MKTTKIQKGLLSAEISEKGAELLSLKYGETEIIWQGGEKYWKDRSPNLFPYVGRLWQKTYIYNGRQYPLDIHGFVKDSALLPVSVTESAASFVLKSSDETLLIYPFEFCYRVNFELKNGALYVTYGVENTGVKTMFFGLGGHPGINVPLDGGRAFEDYALYFCKDAAPERAVFSEDCFFLNAYEPFELSEDKRLDMDHSLFDNDAIILKNHGGKVVLRPRDGGLGVTAGLQDFTHLGLWHRPKTDAPYVCIEPWTSLPSKRGVITDISAQPDLIKLENNEKYTAGYYIRPEVFTLE